MGLRSDLEKVFTDNLSDAETEVVDLSSQQRRKIQQLSRGISEAIVNFLQKQTFTITDMKASIQIENLQTNAPVNLENSSVIKGIPNSGGPVNIPPTNIIFNPLNLGRGGEGGIINTVGYAYLGENTPEGENNSEISSVKLQTVVGD